MFIVLLFFLGGTVFGQKLDVNLNAPTIIYQGEIVSTVELQDFLDKLETDIEESEDLAVFKSQRDLARGFANAGAASTHMARQRSFMDYRLFTLVIGTGAAISAPGVDTAVIEKALDNLEKEGDIYFGMAIQPVTVSLGMNLSRYVDRLRVSGKFGYCTIPEGTLFDDISFASTTVGVEANYQVLGTRSVYAGVLHWRGLTIGTGVNYQSNQTDVTVETKDEDFTVDATFEELGLENPIPGGSDGDTFGTLVVSAAATARINSRTWTVPLEVSTGLRLLYLVDFNLGVGVDFAFGHSEVIFGAGSQLDFKIAAGIPDEELSVKAGSADFGIINTERPQLLRPRLNAGIGLNLGPFKLDIPVMYYFDTRGISAMAGVNVGFVW